MTWPYIANYSGYFIALATADDSPNHNSPSCRAKSVCWSNEETYTILCNTKPHEVLMKYLWMFVILVVGVSKESSPFYAINYEFFWDITQSQFIISSYSLQLIALNWWIFTLMTNN